ncbi:MAG TPA: site-specific integrase, partial [Vampirovibrionales bacterium]
MTVETINNKEHTEAKEPERGNVELVSIENFKLLIDEFINNKRLKPNSQRAYRTDLRYFMEFYIANKQSFKNYNRQTLLAWLKQYPLRAANRRGINVRKFLLWLSSEKNEEISKDLALNWQFSDPLPTKPEIAVALSEDELVALTTSPKLS